MRRSTSAVLAAALLTACLAAAGALARPLLFKEEASWLRVEAPDAAERGRPYTVVVRLERPEPGSYLRADLHGEDAERRYLGYVAGAPAQRVVEGKREYSFDIAIPDRGDLAKVDGIVYLSSDGSWEGRGAVARLAQAPLKAAGGAARSRPVRMAAFPNASREAAPAVQVDSLPLRLLAAAAWAACAALFLGGRRGGASPALALACLCACAWELAMPEPALAESLRRAAGSEGWYLFRSAPQRILVVGSLAAGILGSALVLGRALGSGRMSQGAARLATLAYAGIAALRIVSQHDTDALFASSLAGVQAGQIARTACAALCLAAALTWSRTSGRGSA